MAEQNERFLLDGLPTILQDFMIIVSEDIKKMKEQLILQEEKIEDLTREIEALLNKED